MADYASEQTLQELLAEARAMNATLQKLSSVLGRAPAGNGGAAGIAGAAGAAAGLASVAKSASPIGVAFQALGAALSVVTKGFGILGNILGDLAGRIGNVIGAATAFAKKMMDGTATLTDMVGMFGDMAKQIPLVGGALSGLIGVLGMITSRLESTYKSYQDLANAGMTFSGDLIQMRLDVQNAGLSLTEFQTIAKQNSELFATAGGNVSKGGKLFLDSQKEISTNLKKEFAALGMNAADAAGFLASYMISQGNINKEGLKNSKTNAEGALELARQTQFLSEATGKHRELIQKEIDAKIKEQNFQNFLAGLSEKDAAIAREKYQYALNKAGKDTADMVMTGLMTGVVQPATAAQAEQAAITRGGTVDFARTVVGAKGTTEQLNKTLANANADLVGKTAEAVKDMGTVNRLRMAQGQKDMFGEGQLAELNRNTQEGQIKTREQIVADELKLRDKIAKDLPNSTAAGMGAAQMSLKQAGLKLSSAFDTILGKIDGPLVTAISSIASYIEKNAETIKALAERFGNWFKPWVDRFTSVKSWDEFRNAMGDFFNKIKQDAGPMLKSLWDDVRPLLASVFTGIMDFIIGALRKNSVIARLLFGKTEGEKSDEQAAILDKQKAAVAAQEERVAKAQKALDDKKAAGGNTIKEENALLRAQTTLDNAKKRLSEMSPESKSPPPIDQATNIRNWAYSLMTGQAKDTDIPASIKDSVMSATKDPDLIKQAEDYKAGVARLAADIKAKQEAEAATAKVPAAKPAETPAAPAPQPVAAPVQESSASTANLLNTQLATLVRATMETAENTKRAANILASRGNLLKG